MNPPPSSPGSSWSTDESVGLASVVAARSRISSMVNRTPLVPSPAASAAARAEVRLKLEVRQPTGSFKVRGAANALRSALERGPVAGVVTASTGNHARAVAHLARRHNIVCHAYLSHEVSETRVRALRNLGALVADDARSQTAAIETARAYADTHGLLFIPPFDDPAVISGQGTIGLEVIDDLPQADVIVVPVSGGGLAAGVCVALKAVRPRTQVLGVSPCHAAAMKASLEAGYPVDPPEQPTVADSLGGGLGPWNRYTFDLVNRLLDDLWLVTEEEITAAMKQLRANDGLHVEGAAAASLALLLQAKERFIGKTVVLLVTGAADA